ncbi:unnamed protein product [Chrysoparadoxa australica]
MATTALTPLRHQPSEEKLEVSVIVPAEAVQVPVGLGDVVPLAGQEDSGAAQEIGKVKPVKRKRRKRSRQFVMLVDSDHEEFEPKPVVNWSSVEKDAKERAATLLAQRRAGMPEECHWVRRSVRAAGATDMTRAGQLLKLIKEGDQEVEVLKLHHHLSPDCNSAVMDSVLEALMDNDNCQALYMQNFNDAVGNAQIALLTKLLKKKKIWALNLGENYNVTLDCWHEFCNDLKETSVTHAYLSEHTISAELKTAIRDTIRDNRKKHTQHCSGSNQRIIEGVTNMWWNPRNSSRFKAEVEEIRKLDCP